MSLFLAPSRVIDPDSLHARNDFRIHIHAGLFHEELPCETLEQTLHVASLLELLLRSQPQRAQVGGGHGAP